MALTLDDLLRYSSQGSYDNTALSQTISSDQLLKQANATPSLNVGSWWDTINSGKEWMPASSDLSWSQLSAADQSALSNLISSNPNALLNQSVAGHDILTPDAITTRTVGDQQTQEATPFDQRLSTFYNNYYAPTQSELLYRLSPEIAARYGITADSVAQNRFTQEQIAEDIDRDQMRGMDREALLMMATVLSAGAAGGAFSGAGVAGGEAAGGSAWGSLGDIAAGSGSAAGSGAGIAGAGAADASLVGPATGADATAGAAGTTVSAAPGVSSAGITTTDLGLFGAGGAAAGSSGAAAGGSGSSSSLGSTAASGASSGSGSSGSSGLLSGDTLRLGTAVAGGLLGSQNGAKKSGDITTTTTPWTSQQPYLLDVFNQAKAASAPNALTTQANANYQSALGGYTRNPMLGLDNPYLQKAIDNANSDVTRAFMPAMNQANRSSGSYGNSGVADVYSKAITDAYSRNANTMRMQDYSNQQNLYQQDVSNTLGLTKGVSDYVSAPSKNYAQTIQGNYGGTTSTPYYTNPYANVLGGISTGVGLYNSLYGNK